MASDRYRLAPVADARARTETVRRGELASALGDATLSQAVLDRARARVEAARATLAGIVPAATASAAELVRVEAYRTRCRAALDAARDAETRAAAAHAERRDEVDAARVALTRARADREVIARHFARWREDQKKLRERRED